MSFTIESKKQSRRSFLNAKTIREDKAFINSWSLLLEFIHILTAFYHLPINLVLFTHLLIDACKFSLVGLNYTMN